MLILYLWTLRLAHFTYFLLILEGGEEGRENERETLICCSTYGCIHWSVLDQCVLTRDWTCNLGVLGWCHWGISQGPPFLFFNNILQKEQGKSEGPLKTKPQLHLNLQHAFKVERGQMFLFWLCSWCTWDSKQISPNSYRDSAQSYLLLKISVQAQNTLPYCLFQPYLNVPILACQFTSWNRKKIVDKIGVKLSKTFPVICN